MTELPVADYAQRLAGVDDRHRLTDHAPVWRALGLLNGELDLDAVGRQALDDSPAFYDPATKTIFVTDDLKAYEHLYRFALRRALTTALLDQQFDWSYAVADGIACRCARPFEQLSTATPWLSPTHLRPERRAGSAGARVVSSSRATATRFRHLRTRRPITGRAGVAMRPTIASMANDPVVAGSPRAGRPRATTRCSTPRRSRVDRRFASTDAGNDVLVLRACQPDRRRPGVVRRDSLDERLADNVAWIRRSLRRCHSSQPPMPTVPPCCSRHSSRGRLLAPAESTTTVVPIEGNQVAIQACDPGAVLDSGIAGEGARGLRWSRCRAGPRASRRQTAAGTPRSTRHAWSTAARHAARSLTSPADDAPVLAVDWQPAYVAANIDLALAALHTGLTAAITLSRGSSGTAAGCRGRRPSAWR